MNKSKVYTQYEALYEWFDAHRTKDLMEKPYLDLIRQNIPKGAAILDLGCGSAEPIAKYFIDNGYNITGVDASQNMIQLCKARYPNQQWIVADMRTIDFKNQFDAILAWHSFFHLEHDDQRVMLQIFAAHLKPQGILAFTSGTDYGEIWSDNGGQMLYHASLTTAEYQELLATAGFEVLVYKQEDPACGEATIWVARKRYLVNQ